MNRRKKIVTIGGGHGQANLLAALTQLECKITAIVGVTDDGGCSGVIRKQLGLLPLGDLRRCLTALAQDRALATAFEKRIQHHGLTRSVGNLVLASQALSLGTVEGASRQIASWLACLGSVIPVANRPGTLVGVDHQHRIRKGECNVSTGEFQPEKVWVSGIGSVSKTTAQAIAQADLILLGPGSFFTSVLACLMTADLAQRVVQARASKVLITNLHEEGQHNRGFQTTDYIQSFYKHVVRATGGTQMTLTVLAPLTRESGPSHHGLAQIYYDPMVKAKSAEHTPAYLANTLHRRLGLEFRKKQTKRPWSTRSVPACRPCVSLPTLVHSIRPARNLLSQLYN